MSTLAELKIEVDALKSQVATVVNKFDEHGREVRIASWHNETLTKDFAWLEHTRKSLSASVCAVFDALDKIDRLIVRLEAAAAPPPPPGGAP